ncbi:GFA family protein [Sandarakinorhabdus sp. DWP1-3-1]|uniref:GFA family protein n=1 Tax=Sandarakinorhabdus sp. DWP1-3-1 TaxID=2804627 RepID=UPI003CF85777
MIDVSGGCACGQVRYRARIEPEGYWCHCRMCQRAVGNVAAAFVNAAQSDVELTAAAPAEWRSSPIALRGHCGHCGTPLTFRFVEGDRIDLTVGSLDDPAAVRLASHFGVESKVPGWVHDDNLPTMRSEDYQALQDRWAKAKDTPQ